MATTRNDRINQLEAILSLLDKTRDDDYPDLRQSIIDYGELYDTPVTYNAFMRSIVLNGLNPETIGRADLRSYLVTVLQHAYASEWLSESDKLSE